MEPMPSTVGVLERAARELGLTDQGLVVTHAAISRLNGTIFFPLDVKAGVENIGIQNQKRSQHPATQEVQVLSLDDYVAKYVRGTGPINMLTIDVEGYDFDVLLGGSNALKRTQYLEFENNWVGSWGGQRLLDAVTMLDGAGFTCYWAGDNRLWRLTQCWMDHYNLRFWSNVACVQRTQTELAARMESLFLQTLADSQKYV